MQSSISGHSNAPQTHLSAPAKHFFAENAEYSNLFEQKCTAGAIVAHIQCTKCTSSTLCTLRCVKTVHNEQHFHTWSFVCVLTMYAVNGSTGARCTYRVHCQFTPRDRLKLHCKLRVHLKIPAHLQCTLRVKTSGQCLITVYTVCAHTEAL